MNIDAPPLDLKARRFRVEVATVLAPLGFRLSEEKTRVFHIDEGFDFLGWRIQHRTWHEIQDTLVSDATTQPTQKGLMEHAPTLGC